MQILLLILLLMLSLPDVSRAQNGSPDNDELALFFEPEELYVESASRLKENISEAPAVVNIITARQIRTLGARNLMDVLLTIPGFTRIQDTNETVVAGRGVFATTTHKFLLLRDGHRLNEPMFEEMMPANAISLASIQRIEVLRGPGASLYGNAALLGIINIITLDEHAPSQASVLAGNFGQVGADLVVNEAWSDRQLLFFASLRQHGGERVQLPASQDLAAHPVAGSQKVAGRPFNFDVGMKFRGNQSLLSMSARRAAYNTPRANDGALLTAADSLNTPVQVFDFQHLDIQFLPTWHDIRFTLRHYADRSFLRTPQYVKTARDALPAGKAFDLRIETVRAGMEYSGAIEHDNGTLMIGTQVENFWLLNSSIETSFNNNARLVEFPPLANVSEWNSALYMQEKYNLTSQLILNAGLRWDYYKSFGSSFNPRLALVYNPVDRLYVKFIYGHAFQAPSYFYRTENQGLGYGSPTGLNPEKLDNVQLSIENTFGNNTWLRISAFNNRVKGLITRPAGTPTYQNLSNVTTRGIETEFKFKPFDTVELFATHTLLTACNKRTDASLISQGRLANIPRHAITAGLSWDDGSTFSGSLYANWHSAIASPVFGPTAARSRPANTIPAATLIHFTLNADHLFGGAQAQLAVHNILDKRDWRGGTTRIPYPQEGRSMLLTLAYPL